MSAPPAPAEKGTIVARTLGRLRHPWLFGLAAAALAVDLVIPDVLPFVDEILLLATTTALGLLRTRVAPKRDADSGSTGPG